MVKKKVLGDLAGQEALIIEEAVGVGDAGRVTLAGGA